MSYLIGSVLGDTSETGRVGSWAGLGVACWALGAEDKALGSW